MGWPAYVAPWPGPYELTLQPPDVLVLLARDALSRGKGRQ